MESQGRDPKLWNRVDKKWNAGSVVWIQQVQSEIEIMESVTQIVESAHVEEFMESALRLSSGSWYYRPSLRHFHNFPTFFSFYITAGANQSVMIHQLSKRRSQVSM